MKYSWGRVKQVSATMECYDLLIGSSSIRVVLVYAAAVCILRVSVVPAALLACCKFLFDMQSTYSSIADTSKLCWDRMTAS
jgi:hypothetical protein